jgi:hypothetical protein
MEKSRSRFCDQDDEGRANNRRPVFLVVVKKLCHSSHATGIFPVAPGKHQANNKKASSIQQRQCGNNSL